MREAVRDCIVESYEDLIPGIQLRDEDDRHVVAAAIVAGADAIITYNLNDFPEEVLALYDIEAKHPDEFLLDIVALQPDAVILAIANILARLRNPQCLLPTFSTDIGTVDFESSQTGTQSLGGPTARVRSGRARPGWACDETNHRGTTLETSTACPVFLNASIRNCQRIPN